MKDDINYTVFLGTGDGCCPECLTAVKAIRLAHVLIPNDPGLVHGLGDHEGSADKEHCDHKRENREYRVGHADRVYERINCACQEVFA